MSKLGLTPKQATIEVEARAKRSLTLSSDNLPAGKLTIGKFNMFDKEAYLEKKGGYDKLTEGQKDWFDTMPKNDGYVSIEIEVNNEVVPKTCWQSEINSIMKRCPEAIFTNEVDDNIHVGDCFTFSIVNGVLTLHKPTVTSFDQDGEPEKVIISDSELNDYEVVGTLPDRFVGKKLSNDDVKKLLDNKIIKLLEVA